MKDWTVEQIIDATVGLDISVSRTVTAEDRFHRFVQFGESITAKLETVSPITSHSILMLMGDFKYQDFQGGTISHGEFADRCMHLLNKTVAKISNFSPIAPREILGLLSINSMNANHECATLLEAHLDNAIQTTAESFSIEEIQDLFRLKQHVPDCEQSLLQLFANRIATLIDEKRVNADTELVIRQKYEALNIAFITPNEQLAQELAAKQQKEKLQRQEMIRLLRTGTKSRELQALESAKYESRPMTIDCVQQLILLWRNEHSRFNEKCCVSLIHQMAQLEPNLLNEQLQIDVKQTLEEFLDHGLTMELKFDSLASAKIISALGEISHRLCIRFSPQYLRKLMEWLLPDIDATLPGFDPPLIGNFVQALERLNVKAPKFFERILEAVRKKTRGKKEQMKMVRSAYTFVGYPSDPYLLRKIDKRFPK